MGKEKRDFKFSRRAAAYDEGIEGRLARRFYGLLQNEVALGKGTRILDAGCGTGALLKRLCRETDAEAHGVDVDANMIAVAKRQCPDFTFTQAPGEDIPYPDGYFDVLTACLAYHHFPDRDGFASEAARVLKPGGALYIADPKFPYVIRKGINGITRLFGVVGEFYTVHEITDRFSPYGFEFTGAAYKGFAQVVKLTRKGLREQPMKKHDLQ